MQSYYFRQNQLLGLWRQYVQFYLQCYVMRLNAYLVLYIIYIALWMLITLGMLSTCQKKLVKYLICFNLLSLYEQVEI